MGFFQSCNGAADLGGAVASARAPQARRAESAALLSAPRVVTTGRKKPPKPEFDGVTRDPETGEVIEVLSRSHGVEVVRYLEPVEPLREGVALVA